MGGCSSLFSRDWEKLAAEFLQPMLHLPRHPIALARFGIPAACRRHCLRISFQARTGARVVRWNRRAFFFCRCMRLCHLHSRLCLEWLATPWDGQFREGGSQAITNSLAAYLRELGGEIGTQRRVERLVDLPKSRAVLLDTSPWNFLRIAGERLPTWYRRRLHRFRHAPGIFKIELCAELADPMEN